MPQCREDKREEIDVEVKRKEEGSRYMFMKVGALFIYKIAMKIPAFSGIIPTLYLQEKYTSSIANNPLDPTWKGSS